MGFKIMTSTNTIVLTTKEAKIILDWDDGQWYVSDIDYSNGNNSSGNTDGSGGGASVTATSNNGVKVPEWDTNYKYSINEIVAFSGILYVSKQNQNVGNTPNRDKFWWNPVVDLTNIDAITLEGKNLNEVMRTVLGGSNITDFYKKSEVDNIVLSYFNNVNAKKLGDWKLEDIKTNYTNLIEASEKNSMKYTENYFLDESVGSFDQNLVTLFNSVIVADNINQI